MENLGINVQSMLIYFILFVLLFVILEKKLLPSLRKTLDERKAFINSNIADKNNLTELETNLRKKIEQERDEIVSEAKLKASQIIKSAEVTSSEMITKAKNKSKLLLEETSELVDKYKRDNA